VAGARKYIEKLLDRGLRQSLVKHSDYLSIGMDTENNDTFDHAKLVYVVDLKNGKMHFTGKSYPTCDQVKGLLRGHRSKFSFISLDGIRDITTV
jgi:hypothetical protein